MGVWCGAKNPYKRLVQEALNYLKKGEYSATIEYSDKAIKLRAAFALAYNIKGQALFSLRQYGEALACYEKTLELRPNFIEAINNKGLAYVAKGDYNKAIECFTQSTDLNPRDANVWNYKGLAFHGLAKYEDAIASYDKAIFLRSNYIEAVNNRELSSIQMRKKKQQEQQQQQQRIRTEHANVTVESKRLSSFPVPVVQKTNWSEGLRVQQFLMKIRQGDIVPFIGPGVCNPWIPAANVIANQWAQKYRYPLRLTGLPDQLPRVAQFLAITEGDSQVPKDLLSDELRKIKPPDFHLAEYRDTPPAVLADVNLPIYITTNYDHFIELLLDSW